MSGGKPGGRGFNLPTELWPLKAKETGALATTCGIVNHCVSHTFKSQSCGSSRLWLLLELLLLRRWRVLELLLLGNKRLLLPKRLLWLLLLLLWLREVIEGRKWWSQSEGLLVILVTENGLDWFRPGSGLWFWPGVRSGFWSTFLLLLSGPLFNKSWIVILWSKLVAW